MYHQPVMLTECLEGLDIRPDGIYIDVTFGGGGHSKAILAQLGEKGRLFGFDQDADAKQQASSIQDKRFTFVEANFRHIGKYMRLYKVAEVDGILADLGISSHQIDEASRGFSTRFDAVLDMRMNQRADFSAKDLLRTYSEADLSRIFWQYGELSNARSIARNLFAARANAPIESIENLKNVLQRFAPRGKENKFYAQVFQAIRIEVNDEMAVLEDFLQQTPQLLATNGRLVVMAYHSLEDRLVKNYLRAGNFAGETKKDLFGNEIKPLQVVNRKATEALDTEVAQNKRARSAKLRVAFRL